MLYSIAYVRNTMDTTDAYYDGEIRRLREQMARMTPRSVEPVLKEIRERYAEA